MPPNAGVAEVFVWCCAAVTLAPEAERAPSRRGAPSSASSRAPTKSTKKPSPKSAKTIEGPLASVRAALCPAPGTTPRRGANSASQTEHAAVRPGFGGASSAHPAAHERCERPARSGG